MGVYKGWRVQWDCLVLRTHTTLGYALWFGFGSRWLNVHSGHTEAGMGERILADWKGTPYGQMLAPAICSCARDPGGPMLCRDVPIAKGNAEKAAMARYHVVLNKNLGYWITWRPKAIGQVSIYGDG